MSSANGDTPLYLGLISGTSADAIDVVLASFDPEPRVHASLAADYPPQLRRRVLALARDRAEISLDELGSLDTELGHAFADAALALLRQADVEPSRIHALGSHGQTVRHRPFDVAPYTMQLADPNVIAERTGITTVGDFRRRDIAAGGHAAPLLPGFHAVIFRQQHTRVVLNLGGIANITILPGAPDGAVLGFDTGPANCLLDAWAQRHHGLAHDEGGAWARQGTADPALLERMLGEPYFAQKGPKSSGREVFNVDWLDRQLAGTSLAPVDVQATLLELTAHSIANAIHRDAPDVVDVLACGGGVHNAALLDALSRVLAPVPVASTARYGVDPDFVEATAFAWLAYRRLRGETGNLPSVTGSRGDRVLGAIFFGS